MNQKNRKANVEKLNSIMKPENLERVNAENDKALDLVKLASWGTLNSIR